MPRLISRADLEKLAEGVTGNAMADSPTQRLWVADAMEAAGWDDDPEMRGRAESAQALRAIRTLTVDVAMFGDAIERFMLAPEEKD